MRHRQSFSARLTRYIGIITALLFITVMVTFAYFSHKLIADEATNSLQHRLDATSVRIEKILESVETSIKSNVWMIREHLDDKDYLYHITNGIVEDNPDINGCAVAFSEFYFGKEYFFSPFSYKSDADGKIVNVQLGNEEYDYFNKEWYSIPARTGQPAWSEPYIDVGGSGNRISSFGYPIKDESGNLIAVVTADVPLEWINKIADSVKPYPNSMVMVISKKGAYLDLDESGELYRETFVEDAKRSKDSRLSELAESMVAGKSGTVRFKNRNGKLSFAVYGPLSNGWSITIGCSYKTVLQRVSKMYSIIIILGLLGLCLLSLANYLIIKHLTKPLSEFSDSAMSIAKGDFNTPLPEIGAKDEIGHLRDSFDYMQHSLLDYMENLKTTTATNERLESELNIASKIQEAMLPKNFPRMEGIDLYATMRPAKEVGGDLYDFLVKDNFAYFAIGDVSGKGIPAALFMAITRMALHFITDTKLDLSARMARVNNILSADNATNMFATLLTCALNLETGEFYYCNAGHNRAVILHPDGKAEFLDQIPNLAVGVWPGFEYTMQQTVLEKGSKILLYTDGVTEAEREDKSQYGDDRLLEWAQNSQKGGELAAEQACNALLEDIQRFTEGNSQNDDITIMTIKI